MTRRRLLVLSFYYPPDLSAGSFRTQALVEALVAADPEVRIDVITTLPNRYGTFASAAPTDEQQGRVRIRRIALPAHRSGMADQARAFSRFLLSATRLTGEERYGLVYATSSRLMTAALGRWVARRTGAPLYLDIRDIFVDTITDVLPGRAPALLEPMLALLERWTIGGATRVNLVSRGFEQYFATRYPHQTFSFFTNGIDDEFIRAQPAGLRPEGRMLRVVYAGNMGDGQGLHAIIPGIADALEGRASFRLIGDGGRRVQLERALAGAARANVEIVPPMDRARLIDEYLAADVLFLHLNDHDAFRKVLPSKIFEYAALGKPIWAGVAGHAAEFLAREVSNVAVFEPCNVAQAVAAFGTLTIADTPRSGFVERFSRRSIMQAMAGEVLACAAAAADP